MQILLVENSFIFPKRSGSSTAILKLPNFERALSVIEIIIAGQ
tara:strand:- start:353 stop:481 length:129 start_codon:yes stop_codon:yes gene_type:complete